MTELPNKKWAVWNDEGQPPYSIKAFETWYEAIGRLRELFEEKGLPEEYWIPEGFDEDEDVFIKELDRDEKL